MLWLAIGGGSARAQPVETEPGVRLRLFWIGEEIDALRPIVPDQSPNVDLTIPGFAVHGDEPWFTDSRGETYDSRYVLELSAELAIDQAGTYTLRLTANYDAELELPTGVLSSNRLGRRHEVHADASWDAGRHPIVVRTYAGETPVALGLEWLPPGDTAFTPVPEVALRAPRFYFRPTQGGAKFFLPSDARPGDRRKLIGVHPAYEVETIRPPGVEMPVGGMDVLPDGRLVVATFDARKLRTPDPTPEPNGALWILDGVNGGDRSRITRTLVADGLFEPAGVCVVGDTIYVSQRQNVLRFIPNGSGYVAEIVASGWETNDFHQLSFGLIHEPAGDGRPAYLYLARSPGLGNMSNPPHHGSVWRIDLSRPPGSNVSYLTGGHRTPNGIGWGPEGQIFVSDNQGEWTPANELNHVREGHFYGYYNPLDKPASHPAPFQSSADRLSPGQGVTEAAVRLPQDEIANSPSQPILIPDELPLAGQMLTGDVTYGGIQRLFLEKVNGVWQGAVFRFTQGLEGGVNRLAWGRDGSLYVGGIGGDHASTWAWIDPEGRRTFQGLQRLKPTGRTAFEMETVRAIPEGFEITFTRPVARAMLADAAGYEVRQWTYEATEGYGGMKMHQEVLRVTAAAPSEDGRSVRLTIPGLKRDRVVYIRTDPASTDGETLWSTEVWYTLNEIPAE